MRWHSLVFVPVLLVAGVAHGEDGWDDWENDSAWEEESESFPFYGFAELGAGWRLDSSPYHDRLSLGEARVRLETDGSVKQLSYTAKGDLGYDQVLAEWDTEVRELAASFSLGSRFDVKAGRQVMTWGTGDYVFLNDLFSKDWQAFFIGRDDEYLKAPQDALRLSGYFDWANIELAWTPEFEPDVYPRGERLSLFNPMFGTSMGETEAFNAREPGGDELALRVYRNIGSVEWALYGYDGYTKSPGAVSADGELTFSPLKAWGGSVRMPLGPGLFNAEVSRHKSPNDPMGTDPLIPNSHWRGLVGYERELITRLTGSVQIYVEHTEDYAALLSSSSAPQWEPERNRTLVTTRLTWRDSREDMTLSLYAFYSPSDRDGHVRPRLDYRFDDHLSLSVGANVFFGEEAYSFFGQFEENNNLYSRVRYAF